MSHHRQNSMIGDAFAIAAIVTGAAITLLRLTPDRWNSLEVKFWGIRLRASDSDDE